MNEVQVLMWFCKEQKIVHLLFKIYHETHPCRSEYKQWEGVITKYISFEEYISDIIKNQGFSNLLYAILQNYKIHIRRNTANFEEYYPKAEELDRKFYPIIRKWDYFVKHNIFLREDSLKVGDIIEFNDWGEKREVRIGSIDIGSATVSGTRTDNESLHHSFISFKNIEYYKDKKLEYFIKRNRRLYNGTNR